MSEGIDHYHDYTVIKAVRAHKIYLGTGLNFKTVNIITADSKIYAVFADWDYESFVMESAWSDKKYSCPTWPGIGRLTVLSNCQGNFTIRAMKDQDKP